MNDDPRCPHCGKEFDIDDIAARHGTFWEYFGTYHDEAEIDDLACPHCKRSMHLTVTRETVAYYHVEGEVKKA